ncbi:hypothetical protein SLEP1_g15215 [Rubroshorea leprosula]|uniref:DUF4216 domain-containing protein n=1 Tax=Rubroshorea leprosula TaxID=152421 RepID=A0AAV5IW46_9ROSI|nr:hypothetical protein SLEP1_g15215 [Rubroshorea leprosula]
MTRKTYNCGVCVKGTTINSEDEIDYDGVLKEIIELLHYGHSGRQETVVLFNCDWYHTRWGIRVDVKHGIVDVNPSFQLSTGEPFCLASQAQQVYYTPYPSTDRITRGWFAACKIKSRHLIDTSSTSSSAEDDDIFQDDDPPIMQGSSLATDLAAYQSLQLHAKGVTEVEVNADTSEEDEDYREEKDSETSGNSSDSIDEEDDRCLEIQQVRLGGDLLPQDPRGNGKKGRGQNLKGLRPPENRESRTWVKLTDDKLQFADPSIPQAITALWKSRFDGPYFTFDRVPNNKINEIYPCFKTLYQWDRADNLHVRNAFINCMRHRWSDNMRDVRLKWVKDPSYIPCWMPPHLWSQLLHYWDSDEYKMLQERGAKNRNSGERVTHTTGPISFGIHEMRMVIKHN